MNDKSNEINHIFYFSTKEFLKGESEIFQALFFILSITYRKTSSPYKTQRDIHIIIYEKQWGNHDS